MSNSKPKCFEHLPMVDADVYLHQEWIDAELADKLLAHFIDELKWDQPTITMFGKQVKVPRMQAWYGDKDSAYAYSGLSMQPLPWESKLAKLKAYCEQACSCEFNSVLANLYRDGSDSMGMHSDDEPELGQQPTIASVSLGVARRFDFKHKVTKEKVQVLLEHGSLLIMKGHTQRFWQHGINKSKRIHGPRLNFTFRYVHPK